MKPTPAFDSAPANDEVRADGASTYGRLPNRLLTAFEVAAFVGCHEETVRHAYLRSLLVSQRFGVRGQCPRLVGRDRERADRRHGRSLRRGETAADSANPSRRSSMAGRSTKSGATRISSIPMPRRC